MSAYYMPGIPIGIENDKGHMAPVRIQGLKRHIQISTIQWNTC